MYVSHGFGKKKERKKKYNYHFKIPKMAPILFLPHSIIYENTNI